MVRKKKLVETEITMSNNQQPEVSIDAPEVIAPKNVELTHQALSTIKNDNGTYSVVSIKFNPKEKVVSPVIEVIETNSDLFIVQERISVLLFDINNSTIGEY